MPVIKLRDTQESWLELCFRAHQMGVRLWPNDLRKARPIESLISHGLLRRRPTGYVEITKRGLTAVVARATRDLLR
jgi:hypothetical protein